MDFSLALPFFLFSFYFGPVFFYREITPIWASKWQEVSDRIGQNESVCGREVGGKPSTFSSPFFKALFSFFSRQGSAAGGTIGKLARVTIFSSFFRFFPPFFSDQKRRQVVPFYVDVVSTPRILSPLFSPLRAGKPNKRVQRQSAISIYRFSPFPFPPPRCFFSIVAPSVITTATQTAKTTSAFFFFFSALSSFPLRHAHANMGSKKESTSNPRTRRASHPPPPFSSPFLFSRQQAKKKGQHRAAADKRQSPSLFFFFLFPFFPPRRAGGAQVRRTRRDPSFFFFSYNLFPLPSGSRCGYQRERWR